MPLRLLGNYREIRNKYFLEQAIQGFCKTSFTWRDFSLFEPVKRIKRHMTQADLQEKEHLLHLCHQPERKNN